MLVNCPQCGRSIESPAAGRSRTVPLIVCPCCGKFALRVESTEGVAQATVKSSAPWVLPLPPLPPVR
jgi:ribosomal protein S27E